MEWGSGVGGARTKNSAKARRVCGIIWSKATFLQAVKLKPRIRW